MNRAAPNPSPVARVKRTQHRREQTTWRQPSVIRVGAGPLRKLAWIFGFGR